MSDETTGKAGKTWFYVVVVFAVFILLYTLSIGPAIVLRERRVISDDAVETIYAPLGWIMQKSGTSEWSIPYVRAWLNMTGTSDPLATP
ncbi:MAG: hypothetical protein ABMA26_19730 [Limisphaerales bacterium]